MTDVMTERNALPQADPMHAHLEAVLQEAPDYPSQALAQRGIPPEDLEAYARALRTSEELETLRQLMVAAAKSSAPEDVQLAARLQSCLDPRQRAWSRLQQAYAEKETLSALVTEMVKGGLSGEVQGIRGFIPASHATLSGTRKLDHLLGRELPVRILEINRRKQTVVLSHRLVAEEERAARRKDALCSLREGETREGVVRRITDIGAFVDVGGVDGLLHVSEIAWRRIEHPSAVLKPGQRIQVKLLRVDPDGGRVSLSMRRTQPDPWTEASKRYHVGATVKGSVSEVVSAGAVVQLDENTEGFIPIRELANRRVASVEEVVKPGDEVETVVIEQRPRDRSVILSIRELSERRERQEVESFRRRQRDSGRTTLGDMFGHLFAELRQDLEEAPPAAEGTAAEPATDAAEEATTARPKARRPRARKSAAQADGGAASDEAAAAAPPPAAPEEAAAPRRPRGRKRAAATDSKASEDAVVTSLTASAVGSNGDQRLVDSEPAAADDASPNGGDRCDAPPASPSQAAPEPTASA